MIVKIPKTFVKNFNKDFSLYNINIEVLAKKLLETDYIFIKNPIFKFKWYIWWISIRWFLMISGDIIMPIYIIIKNSKEWENLILDKNMSKKINKLVDIYIEEISNWDFEIFK